jgi:hypothetical protein
VGDAPSNPNKFLLRSSSKHNPNKQRQINKYKQNNHNPRGAKCRTVTPPVKTPNVQILTISNVRSDILEAIDELAAKEDRTRSSFVRRELERIVAEYQAKEALDKSR